MDRYAPFALSGSRPSNRTFSTCVARLQWVGEVSDCPATLADVSGVKVTLEGTTRSALNSRVLSVVTSAIEGTSLDVDRIELVIAGDMTVSCRRRLVHSDAETYSTSRGSGVVAGKTMGDAERQFIVMPAANFIRRAEPVAVRTARHEALHAAMIQRNEDVNSFVFPEEHRTAPDSFLAPTAWNFWNEFRVENALSKQGHPAHAIGEATAERLANTLADLVPGLAGVANKPTLPDRVRASIDAIDPLVVALAYLAGAHHSPYAEDLTFVGNSDLWRRYIGTGWDQLANVALSIPPADQPAPSQALIDLFLKLCAAVHDLYRVVGYEFSDDGDGVRWDQIR